MAAKKFYAVKKGMQTGIFESWAECKTSVDGYPGAEYKGFSTLEDAEEYLGDALPGGTGRKKTRKKAGGETDRTQERPDGEQLREARLGVPPDTLLAYVDGSYQDGPKKYAFGCVFLLPDGRSYTAFGNGDNPESLQQRNVTGEMLGAMYAVRTAMKNGFGAIELRYDYEGIEKWVTGAWRSKNDLTQKYARAMREWGQEIAITFRKVPAHSNVYFNEMADQLAKRGITEGDGIPKVRSFEEMG